MAEFARLARGPSIVAIDMRSRHLSRCERQLPNLSERRRTKAQAVSGSASRLPFPPAALRRYDFWHSASVLVGRGEQEQGILSSFPAWALV